MKKFSIIQNNTYNRTGLNNPGLYNYMHIVAEN